MANVRLRVLPQVLPINGRPVEIQATDTYIQWRYVGDPNWIDLVALADLIGPPGPSIELRSDGTNIQYRIVGSGEAGWVNIVPLADLQGPAGIQGLPGPAGLGVPGGGAIGQVLSKASATDYDTTWIDAPAELPDPQPSTMLVQRGDNSGYETLVASGVRRFLGEGKTIHYFDFVPRDLRGGIADGTDNTTDQASYWQAFRDALQSVADAGGRPHGVIPHCVIRTSSSPNFAIPRLKLDTEGLPQIISLSSSPGLRFDGTGLGPGGWGIYGVEVGPLMAGGASCARGIEIIYMHQSSFAPMYVLGATSTGIHISFCVSTVFDKPICSTPYLPSGAFLATPINGIVLTAVDGDPKGTACGWCTLIGPIAEYVPNGITLIKAQGTLLLGGTAESCSVMGLVLGAEAIYTNVVGTDFEANTTADVHCSAPYCTFTGIKAEHNFTLWGSANRCTINGGVLGKIVCDTGTSRNTFRDVLFATSVGETLTDNGTENRFINCLNHQTNKFHSEWQARSLVAAPSSGGGATFSANGRFFVDGRTVHFTANVSVTAAGTGAGYLSLVLPYAAAAGRDYSFAGIEIGHSGKGLSCYLAAGATNIQIREAADASYPAGENGDLIVVSGSYERA